MKEVYVAKGIDGEILYVGQGNVGRNSHCIGGVSHNKDLNRYYFLNGECGSITTEVIQIVETQEDATLLEKELIRKLKPKYNVVRYTEQETSYRFRNFGFSARAYAETGGKDLEIVENIKKYHPMLLTYVEELGIECLKASGFQESRIKPKYESSVGVNKKASKLKEVQSYLGLKVDDRITAKDLKDKLNECFGVLGIEEKAKASTASSYYVTSRCSINGCRGVKIVDLVKY